MRPVAPTSERRTIRIQYSSDRNGAFPEETKKGQASTEARFYGYILPFTLLKSKLSEREPTVKQHRMPIR
jgi:hypothetical protein